MKNLAAGLVIAALGSIPHAANAHGVIFQTDAPVCIISDCCDIDESQPDFINGPFTAACEILFGPDISGPNFLKEKSL